MALVKAILLYFISLSLLPDCGLASDDGEMTELLRFMEIEKVNTEEVEKLMDLLTAWKEKLVEEKQKENDERQKLFKDIGKRDSAQAELKTFLKFLKMWKKDI